MKETLGEKVKQLRIKEGLSKKELSSILDISVVYMRMIESEDLAVPSRELLLKISSVFLCDENVLIDLAIDNYKERSKYNDKFDVNTSSAIRKLREEITN